MFIISGRLQCSYRMSLKFRWYFRLHKLQHREDAVRNLHTIPGVRTHKTSQLLGSKRFSLSTMSNSSSDWHRLATTRDHTRDYTQDYSQIHKVYQSNSDVLSPFLCLKELWYPEKFSLSIINKTVWGSRKTFYRQREGEKNRKRTERERNRTEREKNRARNRKRTSSERE